MYDQVFEQIAAYVFKKLDHLDERLTYHSKNHTKDVLKQCDRIAQLEHVTDPHQLYLLKVAALYHDTGFLESYSDHELYSCKLFLEDAERFGFSEEEKNIVTGLIMATKIPQQPSTLLEKIICDADLDYLGREDFFKIADLLKQEFQQYDIIKSEDWDALQIKFLNAHDYHTLSSQQIREPIKKQFLEQLI